LSKKYGGIRPSAIGYTVRRLVAKIAANQVNAEAATNDHCASSTWCWCQTCDRGSCTRQSYIYINNLASGQAVLKLDFNNTFNSLYRDIMLPAIKHHYHIFLNIR